MPEAATAPPLPSRRRRGLRLRTALLLVLLAALLLGGLSELRRRLAVKALMATLPTDITLPFGPINAYSEDPAIYFDRRFEPNLRWVRRLKAERTAAAVLTRMLRDARGSHDELAMRQALLGLIWVAPGAKESVPELVLTIRQPESDQARNLAVHDLRTIGGDDPEVIRTLIEALDDRGNYGPDRFIPQTAAGELARLGPKAASAVPALTRIVEDGPDEARYLAINTLGAIGKDARSAVPAVLARLKDQDGGVRGMAAGALGRIIFEPKHDLPPPDLEALVVPALQPLEDDPDVSARAAAKGVLRRINTGHEFIRRRKGLWQRIEAEHRRDRARASSDRSKAKAGG